jgi:VCBS repeat-containing protein
MSANDFNGSKNEPVNELNNESFSDVERDDVLLPQGNEDDALILDQAAPSNDNPLQLSQLNAPTPQTSEPIGTVESVEGVVSVVRADGQTDVLSVGDKVYQGDTVETGSGGGIGITLADTSSFSLGEESEMLLDELVYDPGSQEGSAVLSLLEGTASYVSGQIAKINPDAVAIKTPVATIGIRGTKVYLEYIDGQFKAVNLMETTLEGETPGEIVIFDIDGTPIASANQANIGWSWDGGDRNSISNLRLDPAQVENLTRSVLKNLPRSLAEQALDAQKAELELKEKADKAIEEASEKQKQADEAEVEAQKLAVEAEKAKAEAEALQEEANATEGELSELEAQLAALIRSGASESDILALQNQIAQLKDQFGSLLETVNIAELSARSVAQNLEIAQNRLKELRDDAEIAVNAANEVQTAAREAETFSQNTFEKATTYVGYEVNIPQAEDKEESSTTSGSTNPIEVSYRTEFVPHEQVDLNSSDDDNTYTTYSQTDQNDFDQNIAQILNVYTVPENNQDEEPEDDLPPPSPEENQQQTEAITLSGKGVDGYLSGATVFIDLDKDGVLDAGEISSTTDGQGNYTLTTSATDYVISMTGGTDIATGKAFYGVLQAPAGSTVVTPLTTLIASGVSEDALKTAFGLDASISLTTVDPVEGASDSAIAKVAAVGVQVQNTIVQAASVLEGASSGDLDNGATGSAIFDSIASAINSQGAGFDLSDSTDLQSVITSAAGDVLSGAELTTATNAAANSASIISSSNGVINTYITQGGTGNDFLSSLAQVAVVASDAATALQTAVDTGGDLSALQTQYSSDNLNSKIESAAIGDVNGDGADNTVNAAPTVTGAVALSTDEDTAITITKSQLLTNASDAETAKDSLQILSVSASSGTLVDNGNDTWTLTPTSNATDAVTLSYSVNDGIKSTSATASITVNAINDTPVANDGTLALNEGADEYSGSVSATDVEDSSLSYAIVGDTPAGLTFNANGTYSFDASNAAYNSLAKGATQTVTFTYSATDDDEASDNGTVTITLTGTNDAPTVSSALSFSSGDSVTYQEDSAFTLTKAQLLTNVSDDDSGDTLNIYDLTVTAGGTIVDNGDETWTITPTANSVADITLTYTVKDGNGGSVNHSATVDIDPVNDAPVLSSVTLSSATEDTSYTINESTLLDASVVSDVDGDNLSVSNITVSHGSISNNENGTWTITPQANYNGTVEVTYTISDGTTTVSNTTDLIYLAVNDAPTVSDTAVALSGTEDTVLTITKSQLLTDYASDVEGDTLSISNLATNDGGTLVDNGNDTWSYTPATNVTGTVDFTFSISDGTNTINTGQAQLTLTSVNDAPVISGAVVLAAGDAYSEPGSATINITADQLLANASDVDTGDTLSIVAGSLTVSSGSVETTDAGWTFTPSGAGAVTFTYNVSDGTTTTQATATTTILEAEAVNQAPTFSGNITLTGDEDGGDAGYITITPAQLLADANDDADGIADSMSVVNLAISSGSGSLAYDSSSGNWQFTPTANSTDDVVFTYNISDGTANSAQRTATLNITAINDAPTISDSVSFSGTEDTSFNITAAQLLANASDVDSGDTLSIVADSLQASSGTLVATDSGWTFTPAENSTSNVTFNYTITDGTVTLAMTASATISAVNDAPTVSGSVSLSGSEDTALTITKAQLLANASDVDNDTLQVQSLSTNDGGTLVYNNNDTWTYTPTDNSTSDVNFSYTVYDGTTSTNATAVASFAEDGTTEGTSGVDTLTGTDNADTITALDGADTITGGNGNDYIDGGEGDDIAVFSGNADDYTFGENANGNLTITDNNTADGNDGTDTLISVETFQFADQTIQDNEDSNEDDLGNDSNEWLFGGSGTDSIYGGGGNDIIISFNGSDYVNGGSGDDWIWAGNGNDTITGGSGADTIYADNGTDIIILNTEDAYIDGGNANDTLRFDNGDDLDFSVSNLTLEDLEIFDLQTDGGANVVSFTSSHVSSFNSSKSITIDGGDNDTVNLSDSGWAQGGSSNGYTTYSHADSGSSAQIDENITVNLT